MHFLHFHIALLVCLKCKYPIYNYNIDIFKLLTPKARLRRPKSESNVGVEK